MPLRPGIMTNGLLNLAPIKVSALRQRSLDFVASEGGFYSSKFLQERPHLRVSSQHISQTLSFSAGELSVQCGLQAQLVMEPMRAGPFPEQRPAKNSSAPD